MGAEIPQGLFSLALVHVCFVTYIAKSKMFPHPFVRGVGEKLIQKHEQIFSVLHDFIVLPEIQLPCIVDPNQRL